MELSVSNRFAAVSDNLWPLAANTKRHISIAVPLWPSSCKRNVRERGCRVNSGQWMRKLPSNLSAKKRRRTNHSVNSRFRSRTSRST